MRAVLRQITGPIALRAGALAALMVALGAAAAVVDLPDLITIRAWITGLGPLAPVVFAVTFALAVPAPVPKSVLSTAAGLAFGIPLGAAVVIAGGTAGAIISFLVARWLGRDAVARLTRGRVKEIDAAIARLGVPAALAVRLMPVLPFTVLNYACGVTAMRLRHYTLGTAIGIVPGSTALVALGSLGGEISPWVPALISIGLGTLTLAGGGLHLRRRRRVFAERTGRTPTPPTPPTPPPPPPPPRRSCG